MAEKAGTADLLFWFELAFGREDIGKVTQDVPQGVTMLPDAAPESPAPGRAGVEALDVLVVQLVEAFL